ncbi:hypothetical protein [Ciceribacter sp. RN22]|uniref:hypothetical protein n=1 Tax=Ciceribacter sp. RN22 TaxID=2954932 RepID=UPI002093959A|nr:hypothetical protein [Ciceribacter sp. RN22]MCO6178028.1 hypothetical protein [Ciceribacter sp. RN22]HLP66049.1 hypothetical protein [Rhizobium sp.]
MTIKTISLRTRKPDVVDKRLLQSLPPGLEEITFDLPRLLKTAGVWEALPKRQRRHLRRLAPRLVTVVGGKPNLPDAIRSAGTDAAAAGNGSRPTQSAIHSTMRKSHVS